MNPHLDSLDISTRVLTIPSSVRPSNFSLTRTKVQLNDMGIIDDPLRDVLLDRADEKGEFYQQCDQVKHSKCIIIQKKEIHTMYRVDNVRKL